MVPSITIRETRGPYEPMCEINWPAVRARPNCKIVSISGSADPCNSYTLLDHLFLYIANMRKGGVSTIYARYTY